MDWSQFAEDHRGGTHNIIIEQKATWTGVLQIAQELRVEDMVQKVKLFTKTAEGLLEDGDTRINTKDGYSAEKLSEDLNALDAYADALAAAITDVIEQKGDLSRVSRPNLEVLSIDSRTVGTMAVNSATEYVSDKGRKFATGGAHYALGVFEGFYDKFEGDIEKARQASHERG